MRAAKSGWSTGAGNILTIKDDAGVDRNLLTEYGRLTTGNIDAHFDIYKAQAGRQLQNAAQMSECLTYCLHLPQDGRDRPSRVTSVEVAGNAVW